ncbi:MAG: hypothetical protein M3O67_02715 [Bacteroidota bacterium]|nr:hypothetical protein [Bacteroidota bacterium]
MMLKKWITILVIQLMVVTAFSQQQSIDSVIYNVHDTIPGDDLDYDDLINDLESFLDSISQPHSYFLASISLAKGYFNFKSKSSSLLKTEQKFTYSPMMGYYNKNGLGITATGDMVDDESKLNFYQFSLSPSFDYLQNPALATGLAYTRYFTKDSLPFYTSPLENELYAYFTYRKWWIRPTVALSYGWGSQSDYAKRKELITSLQLRRRGYARVNKTESINDFSITTSVRHDFYWLDVFDYNDHIRFTPQLSFTSGTQKFGFNQTSNTYATTIRSNTNILYNSENTYLDDKLNFQPLSLTLYLRSEYSFGKFFIQPRLMLDYYFPSLEKNFTTLVTLNAGVAF